MSKTAAGDLLVYFGISIFCFIFFGIIFYLKANIWMLPLGLFCAGLMSLGYLQLCRVPVRIAARLPGRFERPDKDDERGWRPMRK